jgi:hypothetical protein
VSGRVDPRLGAWRDGIRFNLFPWRPDEIWVYVEENAKWKRSSRMILALEGWPLPWA